MTGATLIPFHYGDEKVRAYEDEEGTAWFIATDVARILGYKDATHMTRGLDPDEVGLHNVETPGGEQSLSTISEAGLVTVLMRARVEAAKPFRRWITHEVLPSIRKTGSYSLPGASVAPNIEDRALTRARQLVELHMLAQGVVSPDHLEAKIRIILAQARGEHPEIEANARPLYVQDYMRERGATADEVKRCAPTFGKRVKKAYAEEHGEDPGVYFQETPSGQVREVCAYTEADRPLLDRVWAATYANGIPEKKTKKNKEKK